jgi:Ni/Fe-hydrogenase subunit HybB-like protein
MTVFRRLLLIVGFSSLGVWIAIWIYLGTTNRWGAFGVAPLLLPLFLIAALVAGLGLVMCAWTWRREHRIDLLMSLIAFVHGAIFYYASTHT